MTRSRQLVAIMFTDIQGYTALMQQDEKKAIQVREKHRRIFNSITKKYKGRILQYYGDGTLSIFDSAIDAVECGIEMQLNFQEGSLIPVRIGIHTGDIIFSEDEIIGDGVNVASRIESLAVPGSVFVSEKVYDEIKNQESIKTSLLKTFKLKNIEKPIQVYAISNVGLIVPGPEEIIGKTETDPSTSTEYIKSTKSSTRKLFFLSFAIMAIIALIIIAYVKFDTVSKPSFDIQEKSIAVLPFKNMSSDPEQEYFSDGISEEILNSLAKVDELKVAGRTSSFAFKGRNDDIKTIGEKLEVKMVLEGSVRKDGDQLRITAQLINVEDGFHIWSETYDREIKEIFAVQEDIAKRIVDKLKLHIQKKTKTQTQNIQAYESLLKGSYFYMKGYEHLEKAMGYFQKAVELDPDYAEAHAYIGELYLYYIGIISTSDAYAKARAAAQKAISLNVHESRAHKVLAYIHLFYDWDWEATISEYEKSVQYGQQDQNEFITYYYIFVTKDYDQAINISKQILKTDPLRIESHWQLGMCNYFAARFEDALVSFNNALELDPNYSEALRWKGIVLAYMEKYEEAIFSVEKSLEITNGEGPANFDLLKVKILMGEQDKVLETFNPEELIDPVDAAEIYALLNMPDEAIYWLERGYRERSVLMVSLKYSWFWDPIRDDPRFVDLYNRMNF